MASRYEFPMALTWLRQVDEGELVADVARGVYDAAP
jgi:hypothetical protein